MSDIPIELEALHRVRRPAWVLWATRYLRHRADAEEAVDGAVEEIYDCWSAVIASRTSSRIQRIHLEDHPQHRHRSRPLT